MKIKVDEDVFDVVVQQDGSWKFSWLCSGSISTHTYSKQYVHKYLIEEQYWEIIPDEVVEPKQEDAPHYAAAFNMWRNDFVNSPQAYEDSQTVAIRHLTEKLNGEEPSYGQIAAQTLIEYLEKVE